MLRHRITLGITLGVLLLALLIGTFGIVGLGITLHQTPVSSHNSHPLIAPGGGDGVHGS